MKPTDHVCLCHRVELGKVRRYLERENPPVASLISECLDAGTACGWCVPHLKELHRKHKAGQALTIEETPEQYAEGRRVNLQQQRSDKN